MIAIAGVDFATVPRRSSLGDGLVTGCLGDPLIAFLVVLGDGLGLDKRGRPIETVAPIFAAVGLRA